MFKFEFGFKIIVNKEKQKIKHKRKGKGGLTWALVPDFGPPEESHSAAHFPIQRAPTAGPHGPGSLSFASFMRTCIHCSTVKRLGSVSLTHLERHFTHGPGTLTVFSSQPRGVVRAPRREKWIFLPANSASPLHP
jgi:hypothetical protein